jgi:uncharacterized protein YfaQ (DUF2300 family)
MMTNLKLKSMKKLSVSIAVVAMVVFAAACGGGEKAKKETTKEQKTEKVAEKEVPKSIKEGKGVGAIDHVKLTEELDENMIQVGESIYDMKCASCHKLSDQRVVGPGFAGVTNRRKPEWIMNMITNTDVMLTEDPAAQKMLEECLTRMPNQNVSVGDARQVLEFFRKNDMEQVGSKDEAIKS